MKGALAVSLTTTATVVNVVHSEECPDIGPICAERDEPPQLHDQDFTIVELRVTGTYAVSDELAVELQVPFRISDTAIQFRRLDGTAFEPDYENIHHRNETLVGPGDPWLLGVLQGRAWRAKAGLSLPIGNTEENPFALGEMGLPHQHIQFGTGTFNPLLGVELRHRVGNVDLRAHGQGMFVLYENDEGYRAGHRLGGGVEGRWRFGERASAGLMVDVINEQPERWNGEILQDGNLGRTDLLVGAAATVRMGEWSLIGSVRVPVYTDLIAEDDEHGQLEYPGIVELGVSRTFDVGPR